MILMRDGRAEECEDAVTRRLHDIAFVVTDRLDHELERRVDNCSRLLRVEVLHQLRRAFDIGE